MPDPSATGSPWRRTRVVKKFSPHQAGARKLAQRYGGALVCVRHRHNFEGTRRYTTVELVVEQLPISRRLPDQQLVAVRVGTSEAEIRRRIIDSAGQWDASLRAWWMTRSTARQLRLLRRVVAMDSV